MDRNGVIVGPKTPRATRTIAIDEQTVGLLGAWRAEQITAAERAGELWNNRYRLVVSTGVGTDINGGNVRRSLRQLSKETGIEPAVRPYDLRHTAITLQSRLNYSDWQLADWAGTSERMVNEVYRHRTDDVVGVRPVSLGGS